jgi:hypothetical protein
MVVSPTLAGQLKKQKITLGIVGFCIVVIGLSWRVTSRFIFFCRQL